MSKKKLVDKNINKLINEMGAELKIEKEIKKINWRKNEVEKEKTSVNTKSIKPFLNVAFAICFYVLKQLIPSQVVLIFLKLKEYLLLRIH